MSHANPQTGDASNSKLDELKTILNTLALEATQLLIKAKTDNLDVLLSTRATEATLALVKAKTDNIDILISLLAREATLTARTPTTLGQKTMANSFAVVIASDQSRLNTALEPALLNVTATGAVNTGVTATLPAVAGQFHYIVAIELVKLYSVLGVANGAGVIITTTNITTGMSFTTEQLASPAGTAVKVISLFFTRPLRSSIVNTATTFVAPAQLQTIWRWNITYYTAP